MLKRLLSCQLMLLMAVPALAQPSSELPALDAKNAAPTTKILVLGTTHLRAAPKDFKIESLEPLLERLAAFQPRVITIENTSGEMCDLMQRNLTVYDPDDVKNHYCRDTSQARTATGLDIPAALAEMRQTLKQWPADPSAAQRRRLAAVFMAAGNDPSALVQWLQLPTGERRAGDGLDDELVKALNTFDTGNNNETFQIAARLAARLGLQRVFPVDDHTNDNIDVGDQKAMARRYPQRGR